MARRVLAVEAQMMRHQSPYVTALQKKKKKNAHGNGFRHEQGSSKCPLNWISLNELSPSSPKLGFIFSYFLFDANR